MSRPILAAGAALLFAGHLAAQSISPPIAEYREKARGSFVVTNGTLFPLTVVLTPKGFQVSEDGELTDVPLDTTRIHLKLSAMSFRLQPRQAYTVFYEARADSTPAWFSVWAGITGARTDNGIQLRIELPHVVYLNQKARLPQGDVTSLPCGTSPCSNRSWSSCATPGRASGVRSRSPCPPRAFRTGREPGSRSFPTAPAGP